MGCKFEERFSYPGRVCEGFARATLLLARWFWGCSGLSAPCVCRTAR